MRREPPAGFVRSLHAFDKDLRVRWSLEKRKWIIEGRAFDRRGLIKPVTFYEVSPGQIRERILPENSDAYIGFHDGYYPILYTSRLGPAVLHQLASGRMDVYKRIGDYDRAINEAEAREEARRDRWQKSESDAQAGEIYDYMSNRGSQAYPNHR